MEIYICKIDLKHLVETFPKDFIHKIHKWTAGIILIEHQEPDGFLASEHHKDVLLFRLVNFIKS